MAGNLWRWLLLAGLFCCSSCQSGSSTVENKTGETESKARVFSPRMDYDEWTPLGRGDPLKNNPTFDYVPPVLDRVQYWLDSHTTEPSAKRDILVLGVTAKKTSPKIPEQFLKFVDGPKFTRSNQQDVSYRNDFTGSIGAEPPKVLRTSNFRNGPIDYRNQNRIQSSYYPASFYGQKTKPYTMMLPPPPFPQKGNFAEATQRFNTQTEEGPVLEESQFYGPPPPANGQSESSSKFPPSPISQVETIKSVYAPSSPQPTRSKYDGIATPTVSFEKSNLIYQSTETVSGGWSGNGVPASAPTTSDATRDQYEIDHRVAAASSNHEVIVEQNANIIVDGDSNEKEEVVVGQKGLDSSNAMSPAATTTTVTTSTGVVDHGKREEETAEEKSPEKMHIVVANSSAAGLHADTHEAKEAPVTVVMPTNYAEKKFSQPLRTSTVELTTAANVPNESTGTEATKMEEKQPFGKSPTGSPMFAENPQLPIHQHHPLRSHSTFSSRYPLDSSMTFEGPQAPLSSFMHPQSAPSHGTMQFLGSMRPNAGFRAPASIPMFPPMTHMHAPPPPRSTIEHTGASIVTEQSGPDRSPQLHNFPAMFADSPPPSTLIVQSTPEEHAFDRHRSRVPETTATVFTTPTAPPFVPTVSSPLENSRFAVADAQPPPATENASSPRITTVPSLTTDPIFSHYKQPAKPIRGPMYLIIQGHSKVKTYKPVVSKHGIPVERNEIVENATERQLSKFEQFVRENTKSDADRTNVAAIEKRKKKADEKARSEKLARARQDDLMSLVESGVASITLSPSSSATEAFTTIEINGRDESRSP